MYKKYAHIDCFCDENNLSFKNPFVKFLSVKTKKRRIEKHFPHVVNKISVHGIDGYQFKIPIITSINYYEDEEHIKKVIDKFEEKINDYSINTLILSEPLLKYEAYFKQLVAKEQILYLIYIDQIINKIITWSSKPNKEFSYVIIDDESKISNYILDIMCEHINYLTLVTDTPGRYEEKLQGIYMDTGLTIHVTNKSIHQQLDGDIVINCSKVYDKLFYCFGEKAVVIDFISDKDKINSIKAKRKDLKLIHEYSVILDGEKIESNLLAGMLLNQNRLLRNMYAYGYRSSMKENINRIKNRYDIDVKMDLRRY